MPDGEAPFIGALSLEQNRSDRERYSRIVVYRRVADGRVMPHGLTRNAGGERITLLPYSAVFLPPQAMGHGAPRLRPAPRDGVSDPALRAA